MNLTPNTVHLWVVDLAVSRAFYLSSDEKARAARFAREVLCQHYSVAHGALREVLARYLNCAVEDVTFSVGEQGKPVAAGLEFNLSHTGRWAVIAVANRSVGVDIEQAERGVDVEGIARRFFSLGEVDYILAAAEPLAAFVQVWTAKEAFVKATGRGIAFGLDQFEVLPSDENWLLSIQREGFECRDWWVQGVDGLPLPAALAINGARPQVDVFQFP